MSLGMNVQEPTWQGILDELSQSYNLMSGSQALSKEWMEMNWRTWASWLLGIAAVLALLVYSFHSIFSDSKEPVKLIIYAYSTQSEVMSQGLLPEFEKWWESEHGRDLRLEAVFGPSLTLAGQIVLGAPADVAILSDEQHVTYLKLGKMVRENNKPVNVCMTPMVIVTRMDNPTGINDFTDLTMPGLRLIHADPRSSGAGAWAIFAEYGCSLFHSTGELDPSHTLVAIWENVKMLAPSARETMMLFELGAGDAFVTYEQDARLALDRHAELSIVLPACTVVAEPVAVIVDKNVTQAERSVANEFLHYLLSEQGQDTFIRFHLRPVTITTDEFPVLIHTISKEDLGGWSQAHQDLIENLWKKEIEPNLELESGVTSILLKGE
jgi:ABC-type sulfate transport system substrate-binding protein